MKPLNRRYRAGGWEPGVIYCNGEVLPENARVDIDEADDSDYDNRALTPATARRLALALLRAADDVDRIRRKGQRK